MPHAPLARARLLPALPLGIAFFFASASGAQQAPADPAAQAAQVERETKLPPPDPVTGALDPGKLVSRDCAPFTFGLGGMTLGCVPLGGIGCATLLCGGGFFASIAGAGGFGFIPVICGVCTAPCGSLTVGALGAGGATAGGSIAAHIHKRPALPLVLGGLPGLGVAAIGTGIAAVSLVQLGPAGIFNLGIGLVTLSPALPRLLMAGVAVQTAAGPIALAGVFAAALIAGPGEQDALAE